MGAQIDTGSFEALRQSDAELGHFIEICFPNECKRSILAIASLHLELSRVHRLTSDENIAAIRLRWWLDAVAEIYGTQPVRKHPIILSLARLIANDVVDRAVLEAKIDSHRQDFGGLRPLSWIEASSLFINQRGNLFRLFLEITGEKSPLVHQAANHLGVAYGVWRAIPGLGSIDDLPWLAKASEDPNWIIQAITHLDEFEALSPNHRWMRALSRYLRAGLMLAAQNNIPRALAIQKTAAFGLWRRMVF